MSRKGAFVTTRYTFLHTLTESPVQFGLCTVIPAPSCGAGSGSADGRTIGYYQASNTRDRLCNRVSPSQINTDGLTHLYYAFAKIDPNNFATVPANDGDADRYHDFTKLQSSKLQTWIAIGGFDFSDPGPTRHTWYVAFGPWIKDTTSKLMQQERSVFISVQSCNFHFWAQVLHGQIWLQRW